MQLINMRKKNYNYEKTKEKGPCILFGQFLFLDHFLKLFLVGPPNCTYTHLGIPTTKVLITSNNILFELVKFQKHL